MSIEHGIRAVPSEGTRFKSTSSALTKDNYTAWSIRIRAVLIVNEVWDLVNGNRIRPPSPPDLILGASGNRQIVDEATKNSADFQKASNRACCFLTDSISDSIIMSVPSVLTDLAATWKKLQQKFARKSEMGYEAAQKAFLQFEHQESETAEETITRFESVMETCLQQGYEMTDRAQERALLSEPNDRYESLKKNYQYSSTQPDLEQICTFMREDDLRYQKKTNNPPHGAAALYSHV